MKNFTVHLFGTFVLSLLVICIAFGGGYQLNEHGARATGMGGAFVARASDASAIFFNPAGLTQLKGINVLGGVNFIMPTTTFKGASYVQPIETKTVSQVFTPINLYGTYQIDDQFTVGLGIFNPFGLGTEWPDLWGKAIAGPYTGLNVGSLQMGGSKSDLQTWYFNPSVAYKVDDQLSFGLGVSFVYASATIKQKTYLGAGRYGETKLDGTGNGFNFNVGALYKPIDKLSLGLSYRITTEIEFEGDFKTPAGTSKGKAKLPMPGNLFIGAAYEVMPELTVEADIQLVQWSSYEKLQLVINNVAQAPSIKKWDDGYLMRGGAEYKLDDQITLRGGLIYDISPQPNSKTEPMLPDADRFDVTLGGSYKINENLSVDASYMIVLFSEKNASSSSLPGVYNSTAHIISLNVGYSF